ncbi:MAG: hypothetical protein ACRD8U_14855 [Pyrinomonadaceae bacterium]
MTDIIRSERYARRFGAMLYQQRAMDVIEAAEDTSLATAYLSPFNVLDFDHAKRRLPVLVGLSSIGKTAITAAPLRVVVVTDRAYPTAGLEIIQSTEIAKRIDTDSIWSDATGSHQSIAAAKNLLLKSPRAPASAAKLRVERLSTIQAATGLPLQTLAEFLRISRAGLYKWLDAKQDITLQADNRQRLAAIEQLAKRWREMSNVPLSSVAHEPLANGRTVSEILTAENLDEATVAAAFAELAVKLRSKPKTLSQRMTEAGFKRRPSYRSLPKDD